MVQLFKSIVFTLEHYESYNDWTVSIGVNLQFISKVSEEISLLSKLPLLESLNPLDIGLTAITANIPGDQVKQADMRHTDFLVRMPVILANICKQVFAYESR